MELIPLESVFTPDKFVKLKERGHLIDISETEEYERSIKNNKSTIPNEKFWKGKRVLITGVAGMVGSTILDFLIDMDAEVTGAVKRHAVPHYPNIAHKTGADRLELIEVDLKDYGRVSSIIKEFEPNVIFHQAAESFVPSSLQQPSHVVENNCVSTVNVLEAAAKEGRSIEAVQVACSSEQYGLVKNIDEIPVLETNELRPTSTYAATKVFTENIAKAYHYMYRLPTVITRTFNQEGPRRGPQFFTSRVAIQIANCMDGASDRIVIGNPNSVRDFTHIHDSSKAQIIAVEKCERGEPYNVCSGHGILMGDYVKLAMQIHGLDSKVSIHINKKLLRPYEKGEAVIDGFVGSNRKMVERTGWRPTKSLHDIIKDGVAYVKKRKEQGYY